MHSIEIFYNTGVPPPLASLTFDFRPIRANRPPDAIKLPALQCRQIIYVGHDRKSEFDGDRHSEKSIQIRICTFFPFRTLMRTFYVFDGRFELLAFAQILGESVCLLYRSFLPPSSSHFSSVGTLDSSSAINIFDGKGLVICKTITEYRFEWNSC